MARAQSVAGESTIEAAYALAVERYAELGVDVDAAVAAVAAIPVSIHCWQGDDVAGFEPRKTGLAGGLAATGNYPGRARTADELRADADAALALIPGRHRFNLHAFYGEFGEQAVDRNAITPEHFRGWIDWARERGIGLDFNPTYFSHPMAADNLTLSHPDSGVRRFWVEHGIASRQIGAAFGQALGTPAIVNHWVPDGMKDTPIDRLGPRERLVHSLDAIIHETVPPSAARDAVEGKLFGIGLESYTVGSHELYFGYALSRRVLYTLDMGHYHPTESVADKLSAVLGFLPEVLLHVSRGVRWDSDHVVILNDDLMALAQQLVRGQFLPRTHLGLDYFDASINRVAAWVIGCRNLIKALLAAMLEPVDRLRAAEVAGDLTERLALLEDSKLLPFGAVWDFYCARSGVPTREAWFREIRRYERDVLAARC
jgi:L-rhamnose isomerase